MCIWLRLAPGERVTVRKILQASTRQELAAVLGISNRQTFVLEADGVIAPARRGKGGRASTFDLTTAVPAYLAHQLRDATADLDSLSLDAERAALAREQRRKIERENAVHDAKLLPADDVRRAGRAFVEGWKAKLLALPHQASLTGVIARDQVPALKALCRDILLDIASWKTVADATAETGTDHHEGETS